MGIFQPSRRKPRRSSSGPAAPAPPFASLEPDVPPPPFPSREEAPTPTPPLPPTTPPALATPRAPTRRHSLPDLPPSTPLFPTAPKPNAPLTPKTGLSLRSVPNPSNFRSPPVTSPVRKHASVQPRPPDTPALNLQSHTIGNTAPQNAPTPPRRRPTTRLPNDIEALYQLDELFNHLITKGRHEDANAFAGDCWTVYNEKYSRSRRSNKFPTPPPPTPPTPVPVNAKSPSPFVQSAVHSAVRASPLARPLSAHAQARANPQPLKGDMRPPSSPGNSSQKPHSSSDPSYALEDDETDPTNPTNPSPPNVPDPLPQSSQPSRASDLSLAKHPLLEQRARMSEHIHRRAELFRQPDRRPVQPPDIPDDVYLVCLSDKCATANKPSANFQNTRSCIKRAHPITVSKSLCHPYLTASDGLLHPQNREMLRFLWFHLVEHPVAGALLHHAMALPRTHLVFAFAHAVLRAPRHESHRVLLVCPPSIFQEWQTASLSYADHLSIIIPDPQEWPADIDKWSSKGGLLVVSHTLYHHILDHQQSGERRKALEALIRPGPDIIILDDASRLNTVPCQPHRLTRFLNRTRTPARLALTSVPCAADLVRIWPVVDWACPQFLGSRSEYWNDFVKPIADGHRYGSHSGVGHASLARARLLYNKLTTISCSLSPDVRTEALIARDKRMIESTICVNLHSQQAAVYAKVEKTLAEALGHGRISPYVAAYLLTIAASETTALRRCLTAGADERYTDIAHRRLMGPLDRARDVFRRILEELGPPEEIPIFCSKMKVVIEMSQRAISDSERLVVFCGSAELQVEVFNNLRKRFSAEQVHDFDLDANESARMDSLDHFNENGAVFVAPYGPSLDCIEGAGWSFVNATRVLMLDSGWHYLSTVQAINRVFGYSQVCPVVHVYHVIAQGTIEQAFRKDMIDRHVEMLRLRSCGDGRISVSTFAELRNFLLVPEIPTIYFRTEPPELKAILASPAVIGKVPVITAHPEHTAKHEEYISQFRSMHMDSSQNNPLVHQIILDDNKHEIMSHSFTGAVASVSDLTAEEGETECIRKNKDTMLQDFNPVLLKLGGRQYDLHERLGGLRCDALAQDELFQEPPEIPCNLPAGWHEYSRLFESDAIPPLDKQLAPQKSVKRRNTPAIERSHEEPPRTRRRFLDDPDFE